MMSEIRGPALEKTQVFVSSYICQAAHSDTRNMHALTPSRFYEFAIPPRRFIHTLLKPRREHLGSTTDIFLLQPNDSSTLNRSFRVCTFLSLAIVPTGA